MFEFCNTRSVRSLQWALKGSAAKLSEISSRFPDVPKQLIEIILRRGVGEEDIAEYLNPSLRGSMPNPSNLAWMDQATEKMVGSICSGEKIAIFADYDVDGATSGAQMVRYLRLINHHNFEYYVPQRMSEGYGPNIPAISELAARGATLLLIVDSGTTQIEPIAHARSLGMDVVVLDHHEPLEDGKMPDATVVNPHRHDDTSGLTYLCTAGLVFLFMASLNRALRANGFFEQKAIAEPKLIKLSGLAALGTVCDVASLRGFNRAIVSIGLDWMDEIPGIRAIADILQSNQKDKNIPFEYSAFSCGYRIGPPINAAGRIDNSMRGIELLINDDFDSANAQAQQLYQINRDRKERQDRMIKECTEQVKEALSLREGEELNKNVIIAYNPNWHPGIVGIVAGRIRDTFDQSAILIGDFGKGSARAVGGFNIGQAFLKAKDNKLLISGGGHAVAAGLTIDPDRIQEFADFIREESKDMQREPLLADLVLPLNGLKQKTVESFAKLEPMGKDNDKPLIAFTGGVLEYVEELPNKNGGREHLKCMLTGAGGASIKVLVFEAKGTRIGNALINAQGRYVDVLGRVSIETWGSKKVSMVGEVGKGIEDLMVGEPARSLAMADEF